jgi:threonine aldolase
MSKENMIDLRSDTVTRPTPRMREAMAGAEVGDDVYGEDPTANRLQEMAAELLGFEAAIFMPTGSMGNQVALQVHCRPGREVICEAKSHILNYEMAAMSALSGLIPNAIYTEDGLMTAEQVASALRPDIYYYARTGLVALENTHNMAGGKVMPLERQHEIQLVAEDAEIKSHLDGARIFNAAAHLGVPVSRVAAGFDSVMFCLSKGLGAPVGSILCGSEEFIAEARRVRKMFGGGMRQAGIIAAAGIVALEDSVPRIGEDNETAMWLAEGLSGLEGLTIPVEPETNILMVHVNPEWYGDYAPEDGSWAGGFASHLGQQGVHVLALDSVRVRMVTHYDLPEDMVERVVEAAVPG